MKNQIILLFLLIAFCAAPVFAQEKSKDNLIAEYQKLKENFFVSQENQCKIYDKEDFSGKPISLNFDNADIRDVLKEVTKQIGVEFEIDKSIGQILITGSINGSWNFAINSTLESIGLEAQKQCPVIRIVKSEKLTTIKQIREVRPSRSPLFTEIIKLENLKLNYAEPNDFFNFEEGTKKLIGILNKFLTRRGAIEIDTCSNSFIITDLKDRAELISNFVKLLDKSGFTLKELMNEPAFEIE